MRPKTTLQSLALLAVLALVHPVQARETVAADGARSLEQRLGSELSARAVSPYRRPEGEHNRYLRWIRGGEAEPQPAGGIEMATEFEGRTPDRQRQPRTGPDRLGRG
jgi:hypothetical protein